MSVKAEDDSRTKEEELFWKNDCRESLLQLAAGRLGRKKDEQVDPDQALEALELETKNGARLNRSEVFLALALAARSRMAHELFDPAWVRRREKAYAHVESAIGELRAVLRERGLEDEAQGLTREIEKLRTAAYPPAEDRLRADKERLERELENVKETLFGYYDRSWHPIDWGANTRAHLLSRDRVTLKWAPSSTKGGSPPTRWLRDARKQLRAAGASKATTEAMLEAVGIARRYSPRRKTSEKK